MNSCVPGGIADLKTSYRGRCALPDGGADTWA
ncbi:rCG21031, partial [Rattus norvegicus]